MARTVAESSPPDNRTTAFLLTRDSILARAHERASVSAPLSFSDRLAAALAAGTTEHYEDAALYDHEYKRRRDDVRWYRELAARELGPPDPRRPILELGCG